MITPRTGYRGWVVLGTDLAYIYCVYLSLDHTHDLNYVT